MAETSGISWTDATFNPWLGCAPVSPACDSCYAEVSTPVKSLGVIWGPGQERRRTSAQSWKLPVRWNRQAFWECKDCGARFGTPRDAVCASCAALATGTSTGTRLSPARRRVFCASLADVFDNEVDPAWRADLFELIVATPNLDWLLLTKRIGNVRRMVEAATGSTSLPANVWLGATIANQEEADRDIRKLLAIDCRVRFLSVEPMLGPISLRWAPYAHQAEGRGYREYLESRGQVNEYEALRKLDWVIVGGESGSNARPMNPAWARTLRDECAAAEVAFLFKQWGENLPAELSPHPDYPKATEAWRLDQAGNRWHRPAEAGAATIDRVVYTRVGKKAAGDLLDGRRHHAFPEIS